VIRNVRLSVKTAPNVAEFARALQHMLEFNVLVGARPIKHKAQARPLKILDFPRYPPQQSNRRDVQKAAQRRLAC